MSLTMDRIYRSQEENKSPESQFCSFDIRPHESTYGIAKGNRFWANNFFYDPYEKCLFDYYELLKVRNSVTSIVLVIQYPPLPPRKHNNGS